MTPPYDATLRRFETAVAELDETWYELTLFVIGASDLSARAIANVRQLCDIYLDGRYHLVIIDLHDDPDAMLGAGVIAAPTLVKHLPLPTRKLIGDLSNTERVLLALELPLAGRAAGPTV